MTNPPPDQPNKDEIPGSIPDDSEGTLDSSDLLSLASGSVDGESKTLAPPSDSVAEGATLILPSSFGEPNADTEGKTVLFDTPVPEAEAEGKTMLFSVDSPLPANAGEGDSEEAQTLMLGPSGVFSGGGSFLLQNRGGGTEENLMRVWEAAIGSSQMESRRSLRYEVPEASESILGRVATRIVADAHSAKSHVADYQIQEKLGEGGMGLVFSAIQTAVNRKVALKTLKQDRSKDPSSRKQFFYEAEITADLDHPNIPPIYEFGSTSDDVFFYTMKLIRGSEWQKVISNKPQAENLDIFNSLMDAIAFAHSKNVIHRDIKPENLILGAYGEVYVTDWGMAVNVASKSSIRFGGTPDYMAPEMANDDARKIGKWSDVYLLGAVLFQIMTGHPPHPGKNAIERLLAARANKIRTTSVDDPLLDIAMKAMETNPKDRYKSVEELQSAVREVQRQRANIKSSIDLTVRSQEVANEAMESKDYDSYTRAIFGFRDAIELWDGNREAETALKTVRLSFGQCAYERGDYDLAIATLDVREPDELMLFGKAEKAKRQVALREKRFKSLRNTFFAFLGLAVIAATIAAAVFDGQRRIAIRLKNEAEQAQAKEEKAKIEAIAAQVEEKKAKEEAIDAKALEEKAKDEAIAARVEEEKAKNDAIAARAEEEKAKNEAIDSRAAAVVARQAAEVSADLARKRLAQVELGEQLTKLGFASAQADQFNPLGAVQLLKQVQSNNVSEVLQSRLPKLANWAMNRTALLSNLDLPKEELSGAVTAFDFTMVGNVGVVGVDDGSVRLLTLDGQKLVEKARKQLGLHVAAASISPSGDEALLAVRSSSAGDDVVHHLVQWQLSGDFATTKIESTGNRFFQGFGYSPDGHAAIAGIRGGVWGRIDQGPWQKIAEKIKGEMVDIAWVDNDSLLLLGNLGATNHLYLLPELRADANESIVIERKGEWRSEPTAIASVKDRVFVGTADGNVVVCRLESSEGGKVFLERVAELPRRHRRAITQIDFDGEQHVITNSREPVAHAWRLADGGAVDYETALTGTPSESSDENNIERMAFISKDRVVNVDSRGVAVAMDILRQKQRRQLTRTNDQGEVVEKYAAKVVGLHPRGSRGEMISVDENGTVDLWDLRTGKSQRIVGDQADGARFSYFGHSPGAIPVDLAVDAASGRVLTSARLPMDARLYASSNEHNREFCLWDQASGALLRRWSDRGDEPRLSSLGRGEVLINNAEKTQVLRMAHAVDREDAPFYGIASSFAVANPAHPEWVVMFKRTGGSGMGWLWNRDRGTWFDPDANYLEFANAVPLHAFWSEDGDRMYVLDMNGDVLAFRMHDGRLSPMRSSQTIARLPLSQGQVNALRSHQDVDGVCETRGTLDRLTFTLRETRLKNPQTCRLSLSVDVNGDQDSMETEVVEGLRWENDIREFEVKPEARVVAKRRSGERVFVSMKSGVVYGLEPKGLSPTLFGRQEFIESTADAEGKHLITRHRDGSLLMLDLSDLSQVRWSRLPYALSESDKIVLASDGSALAAWDRESSQLNVLQPATGELLWSVDHILAFAWDPVQPNRLACVKSNGEVMQTNRQRQDIVLGNTSVQGVIRNIQFFIESWQDASKESVRYVVVHREEEAEGTLQFLPLNPKENAAVVAANAGKVGFEKSVPKDVHLVTSPVDPIFVTGDSTGTCRVWFASPTFQIATQLMDLRNDGDAPVVQIAFDADGETLVSSDGNQRVYGWMSIDRLSLR